jgi:hypothetical protein
VPRNVYVITSSEARNVSGGNGYGRSIRFGAGEVLGVTSLARASGETQIVAVTDVPPEFR